MSYDIDIVIDTGTGEKYTVEEVGNYTSNVSPMWTKAIGRPLADLHGMTCSEATELLRYAVVTMISDLSHYEQMNPPNGWGDAKGALEYILNLYNACARHPNAEIHISH